ENLAGYDDTTETLTIYLPPETLAEADPNTQDSLVEAAINAAVNANWTDMRPAGSTASAPVVQAASGLGAQAAADAASGGQTAIKAECGGVLGNEPVAEVDAAAQDALVAAAINAAISANWAAMRPAGSTASAPVVQTTSGLGAQAVYDAEYFGQTAIKAEYGGVLGQDAVAAIVSPTEITGKAFAPVNITTRHLIGDLDSVLMSTLNGGSGLSKALAGAIEVQDRAGNTALLDFTQKELDSIQTLNDAVRMLNAKLGTAGIGIAVKINDAKTGLKVEDTTGSTTNALIFRDKTSKEITTPAVSGANAVSADDNTGGTAVLTFANSSQMNGKTFAFTTDESSAGYDSATGILTVYVPPEAVSAVSTPAVPGVNAVSADNGTGGTAALTFADSSQMNGKTFAFTTDESSAGYDSATGILTVYLSPETLAETDPDTQDSLVEAAINAAVNANWTDMRPDGSTASAPVVQTTSGLGAQAVADAASGGQTAIKADAAGAVLGQEPVAAVDAGPVQDSLVVAAINAAISANWTAMRPDGSTASAPVVRSTSGLGAQAVADAANGGRTAIKDGLTGAALGREPVEEVSITHDSDIATQLGLEVNVSASSAGGASLNRQIISYDTKLADLNNGKGVTLTGGKIQITDSAGHTATLAIDAAKHKTVGDVINAINSLSTDLKVIAKINDTGDGIVLEEFAGGTGNFSVIDADSSSKFASELRIAGTVAQSDKDEDGRMRLNGRQSYTVEVEATDSLESIRDKLNALNAGFSATIIQDGSNAPYRLAITGKTTGAAGAFNIDLSALGLTTENMTEAKDALLVYGDVSTGLVLHSSSNSFKGIVGGIDLTIAGTSTSPITITSADSNVDVKASLSAFVENYNKFRNELNTQMYYSVAENAGNVLYNSSEARALDRDLTNLLQKRVYGIPGITSLADIGITLRSNASDDGVNQSTNTLVFDEAKFEALWESNKEGLQAFFFQERTTLDADGKETTIKTGWAQSFVTVSDSLTDVSYGKISSRLAVIDTLITNNTERAEFMQSRLDTKRARMLAKFYAMEQALAAMSDDMNTISSLASSWSSLQSSTS
ncbi:MAG: flagellar filament capping protein FliD, partial [Planctomycetaceae bacterium]|nr:flagellar filament capping protein FliD [Planctomycetaceae bacterium]